MKLSILFIFLLLTGCKSNLDNNIATGKAYFDGFGCVRCHQIDNVGGNLGPDLTLIGFRKSEEWIDQWIKNPPAWKKDTIMPNFYLKEDIRKDIVSYLASLDGKSSKEKHWKEVENISDPIERGKIIYKKAGCVGCHNHEGIGGYPNNNVVGGLIPSLTHVADGYSKEELKDRIRNGVVPEPADHSKPAPLIEMPAWKTIFNEKELDDLVEYLFSLRPELSPEDEW